MILVKENRQKYLNKQIENNLIKSENSESDRWTSHLCQNLDVQRRGSHKILKQIIHADQ